MRRRAFLPPAFLGPTLLFSLKIVKGHHGTPHERGRRGGKSFILASIAVFVAGFKNWRPYLGPGEVGTVMVVAADRRQARTIMRFALGLLQSVPMLNKQIIGATLDSITLKNKVVIDVHTASFRSTRGYSIVAALLDEIAYWPTDDTASDQDVEVINAVKPGMATIPEAMLLCASSPHARKARCGRPAANTTAMTAIRCWSGRRQRVT